MINAKVIFEGDKAVEALARMVRRRTRSAAEALAVEIQRSLGASYPPASSPGTPPHRRTGELQASVLVGDRGGTVQVSVTAPYAGYLEQGTRRMAARPFVQRALIRARRAIENAMKRAQ